MSQPCKSIYSTALQESFELEYSVFHALLKRNRCSHERTKYFRGLQMIKTSIERHELLSLYLKLVDLQNGLKDDIRRQEREKFLSDTMWDTRKMEKSANADCYDERVTRLQVCVYSGIPDCVGRIEYASKFLFDEISKGFFIPFCLSTVACIARIRSILKQLGKHALQRLDTLHTNWRSLSRDERVWNVSSTPRSQAEGCFTEGESGHLLFNDISVEEKISAVFMSLGLPGPDHRSWTIQDTAHDDKGIDDVGVAVDANFRKRAAPEPPDTGTIDVIVSGESLIGEGDAGSTAHTEISSQPAMKPVENESSLLLPTNTKGDDSVNAVLEKKRKKKERKKKGDFFDDLFASR